MRICHIITRLIVGGAQENTVLTCRGLVEKGHDVTLMSGPETGPEGSLWEDARRSGVRLIPVDSLLRAIHPLRDWKALRALRRELESLRPNIVHTHSSKAGIVGRLAARQAGVPIIVHTIHGMSFHRTQPRLQQWFYRWLERRASRCTDIFIAVADAMVGQSVNAGIAAKERFITIRSGMMTEQFRPHAETRAAQRREWRVSEDDIVVGTIARLFDNKGYDELIAAIPIAIARRPNLRFVWIGDGSRRREYERRLTRLGVRDRVTMLGLIPPERIGDCINGFDLLVHASRWEGLPRAVVQALLTEVPAISFAIDGAPEVITPGKTGLLLPLGDVHGLAEAIVELAGDGDIRRAMGRQGRQRCLAEFDWRKMTDELDALYHRLQGARKQTAK